MARIESIAMLSVLGVRAHLSPHSCSEPRIIIANLIADIQTAIMAETTTNLTPLDDLKRRHPFGGPGKPEDVAKFAVVLASDDAAWVSGANMYIDGAYTAR